MRPKTESALAKIRKQRRGEAKATEQYEVRDENAEIYQTLTEEDYQKLKETRRAQHWVEGEGYSDDGEEWWESDSGGDFAEDDSLEDEGDEEAPSRRDTTAGGKRKKSMLEQGGKKGRAAAGGGEKRARKGGLGGAAGGEAQQQQQQQSMRMRSLVQHFTARAAETAAVQQQQRLTQRDAESLRSIDKLLEDEEEAAGVLQTADEIAASCTGRRRLPNSWVPSAHVAAATDVDRPYSSPTASRGAAAAGTQHTGRGMSATGRGDVSRRIPANSQDYLDRGDAGLEPTQALGEDSSSSSSELGSGSNGGYNAPTTSFLEQLGLGNSCVVSYDSKFATGRPGEVAAAPADTSAALLTRQSSGSGRACVAATGVATASAQCRQGEVGGSSSHASESREVAAGGGEQCEVGDGTAADVDTGAARENDGFREEERQTGAADAADELQGRTESLFKSTGEFEQHKTGGGIFLMKHAQPDFFLWADDEDEQETESTPATLSAGSTGELKSAAAAAVSPAVAGHSSSAAGEGTLQKNPSSTDGQAQTTPVAAEVAGEAERGSALRAAGGPPCCKDGTLPFYFLDAWEEDGLLFLFGKVWVAAAEAADGTGSAGLWSRGGRMRVRAPESCCVVVRDMMVPLFFRTREQVTSTAGSSSLVSPTAAGGRNAAALEGHKENGRESAETSPPSLSCARGGSDTGSGSGAAPQQEEEEDLLRRRLKHRLEITRAFFMQDAQRLKKKYQWRKVAIKGVFRHYAFDAPGVPRDRDQTFVKMYVPAAASGPLLQPEDWEGETYTHVFGTRASLVELLLVKRRIKGPCWLRVRDFSYVDSPLDRLSWCKHEVVVHSHKAVCCWDYKLQTPGATLSSKTPSSSSPSAPVPSPQATVPGTSGLAGCPADGGAGAGACATILAAGGNATPTDGALAAVQTLPPPHPPPLTVVSVCLRTLQVPSCGASSSPHLPTGVRGDITSGEKQLAIAAFFVYRNADLDDQAAAAPRLTPQTAFCAVRRMRLPRAPLASPPDSAAVQPTARVLAEGVPLRFSEASAQQGFTLFDSERSLLLTLVNQIAAADPDIILGHDVYSCTLDLLAQRLGVYGLPVWHRLSRLKRGKQQLKSLRSSLNSSGKGALGGSTAGGSGFLWAGRTLTVGRLVCDTYLQSRELLPHRVDYDLPNLLQALFFPHGLPSAAAAAAAAAGSPSVAGGGQQKPSHGRGNGAAAGGGDQQRLEAVVKGLRMFPQQQELLQCFHRREPQALLACMHLTLQEAYVTLLICWRLNCLPLTRELTTIGGNLWNRSLQNQRAERNAFLLLHEFHREKYVCPDPPLAANTAAAASRRQLRRRGGAAAGESAGGAAAQQQRHHTRAKKEQFSRGDQRWQRTLEESPDSEPATNAAERGMADEDAFVDCEDPALADAAALQEDEEALGGTAALRGPGAVAEATGGGDATSASASYTGGLVLEPRVGYFETFVLLLDFNSLYPSIIQEFNVCFSTVKRAPGGKGRWDASCSSDGTREGAAAGTEEKTEGDATGEGGQSSGEPHGAEECTDSAAGSVQGVSSTPGVLPRILRQLVQRRRAVKASMKTEANPVRRAALEVKQLALKLTANSIYGCLGFSHSRFYARDLAAFITQQGRSVLLATKEKVERVLRLEVLYGDTDSLMINTGLHDDGGVGAAYAQAVRLGEQVKAEINRNYRRLEIDLEAVFRRLLLLRKKKYACCIVVDYAKQQYRLEQKGLDFVRRDWAKLTRVVGQQLLEILFATGPTRRPAALPSTCGAGEQHREEGHHQQQQGGGGQGEAGEQPVDEAQPQQRLQQPQGSKETDETVDVVVEKLHAKLEEVARQLREKKVPLEYFVITKALTKLPHLYPRGAGGMVMHPHVQVALRMQSKGVPIKPGSEIPFVICTAESARAVLYPSSSAVDSHAPSEEGCVAAGKTGSSAAEGSRHSSCTSRSSSNPDSRSIGGGSSSDATGVTGGRIAEANASESSTTDGSSTPNTAAGSKTSGPSGTSVKNGSSVDSSRSKTGGNQGAGSAEKVAPLSAAERAFHPREVLNNPVLEIDVDYYVEQQLLPPVLRLCAHVQGTSSARLAQCLGLDASKHARGRAGGGPKRADSDDEDGSCSREARERAGEEQILALLARTDEKYKNHPLPIHLRCESCRAQIAGKDVLRFMRCPSCLWWISPSILSNFIFFTLAALQRRFTQAVLGCTACEERYVGLPTPAAAIPRRLSSAGAAWQQQQEQQARAAAAAGWVRCPRCEEGRLREEMTSHDMYVYLDQLLFYVSGDVTAQQRLLADKFSAADEREKADLVWKHYHSSSGLSRASAPLNGSSSRRGDDTWLVPAGLDANFRVRVLPDGKGKLLSSGSVRQGALAASEKGEDLLEDLYGRVTQQEVNVKRGAQLRYPGLTAAVTYWQKSKRGLGWIDMQRERNKLRAMINEVMEQNAYRMLKLSSLYSVMKPPSLLDPTKRRWRVVEKLNLLKQTEAARDGWNEELRCRAPALLASLEAVAQSAHAGDLGPAHKAVFDGFACFANSKDGYGVFGGRD